jgi:hypothetical protein
MMTTASHWRLDLAADIATWYSPLPHVQMIAVGGSTARRAADSLSDLDLVMYWQPIDFAWFATPPLQPAGATRITCMTQVTDNLFLEQYVIATAKIDIAHIALSWWEQLVADVLDHIDTTPANQDMLAGFLQAHVLYGEDRYTSLRTRIAAYPDTLAHQMVQKHLWFGSRRLFEQQGLLRGDVLTFYDTLCRVIKNVVGVLAGLNRVYLSTEHPKRVMEVLHQLPLSPAHAAERVQALLEMDRTEVPAALASLVEEVLTLVEQQMPEVDTGAARYRFSFLMEPCTTKPPLRRNDPSLPRAAT